MNPVLIHICPYIPLACLPKVKPSVSKEMLTGVIKELFDRVQPFNDCIDVAP